MVEVLALTKAALIAMLASFFFCRSYCHTCLMNSHMPPSSSPLARFETHKGWFLTGDVTRKGETKVEGRSALLEDEKEETC